MDREEHFGVVVLSDLCGERAYVLKVVTPLEREIILSIVHYSVGCEHEY